MSNARLVHFSAGRTILFALFCAIVIGVILLSLPIARRAPIAFIDIFFTVTSVTCVTGIFTVPFEQFTFFGHCVILGLMQIGGLGIITLTLFVLSLFMNLGLATQLMAGKLLELESWKNIRQLLFFIISITALIESLGALILWFQFSKFFAAKKALFYSVFHSVSFFCNAGISLFNNSLQLFANNYTVVFTALFLILLGGTGFVTIYELFQYFLPFRRPRPFHFSLQSKIIIYATLMGIGLSTLLIYLVEHRHAYIQFSFLQSLVASLFHAVSFRSAGLLIVPIAHLQMATLFLIMIISFVGSAPGSTGSGIKLTTLTIYLSVVKAAIEGHTAIHVFNRRIAKDQVNKAIAIISLGLFWILITIFCMLVLERQFRFIEILFEVMSCFTNIGLSLGITERLGSLSKLLLIFTMIIGRMGSLTLILAIRKIAIRKEAVSAEITYPEERIMLS